ncbi:MAG TPA: tripartite tricarboxylate transporter substrate binding protein, partial [Burkholderiales bacterium]|nr:tripartite tricarboxylate transporter substrate binding protein [Burkholderiales bacterium]
FPPGGGTDAMARVLAPKLSEGLGQQVVIENRGGAGATIGTELAAKSAPDGYTLVLGNVAPLAILPGSGMKLTYDPVKDFLPVSLIATSDYILTVHPSLPAHSVKELIVLAKSKPGALTYASSGNMGGPHLAGELINLLAKLDILHVPYKGNGPAAVAILTGESQLMFGSGPSVVPHIDAGKLRALATTGPKRTLPPLPTMGELLPGYEVTQWYGILVPAGTPKEIVTRLHKEIVTAISNQRIAGALVKLGTQPVSTTSEEFAAFIKSEAAKYAKLIKAAKITPE